MEIGIIFSVPAQLVLCSLFLSQSDYRFLKSTVSPEKIDEIALKVDWKSFGCAWSKMVVVRSQE